MALPLSRLPEELFREVRARKWTCFFVFAFVSALTLVLGLVWPYKFQSEVIIFVDDKNIIRPLMEGTAVATKISDRVSAARELLWGRQVLNEIVDDVTIWGPRSTPLSAEANDALVAKLRSAMQVRPRGDSFFSVSYTATDAREAFLVAQRLGQVFIEETNRQKRAESRSAYDFVDKQVKAYEDQLKVSEDRLKQFLSENVDGTEAEVNGKLAQLRGRLELAQIELREAEAQRASLQQQLAGVNRTFRQERSEDLIQRRILAMQEQLDLLRLRYHDTYPDIISLQEQIQELTAQREAGVGANNPRMSSQGEDIINPLYQELRAELAKVLTSIETIHTRIRSLEALLETEVARMERIQANKAQFAELTRDMEVNTSIYNDLLKRREKARVSMHLDIEGQGLSYRIHEPAQFPTAPSGGNFTQFAAAGLFLGILAPFGIIAGLLQVDPRIRTEDTVIEHVGLPVLGMIPEVRTPFERRKDRNRTVFIGILVLLVLAGYVTVATARWLGWF